MFTKKAMFIFLSVFLLSFVFLHTASADQDIEYKNATIQRLTNHLSRHGGINFDDSKQFKEYAIIEDCQVLKKYFENDFDWNRIRLAFKQHIQKLKAPEKPLKLRIPGKIQITRYNFTTESFDLENSSILKDVGYLQISSDSYDLCDGKFSERDIKNLPNLYYLKLDTPLNIFRIPVSKPVALGILEKTAVERRDLRSLYIDIKVSVDDIATETPKGDESYKNAFYFNGKVESIDFYTDENYRDKFKTIYYGFY